MDRTLIGKNEKADQILQMKKREFHRKIIRKITKTPEFAKLVNFGLEGLSRADADKLISLLDASGVKDVSRDELLVVAYAITARAASYQ